MPLALPACLVHLNCAIDFLFERLKSSEGTCADTSSASLTAMIALLPHRFSIFSAVYRTTLWMNQIDEATVARIVTLHMATLLQRRVCDLSMPSEARPAVGHYRSRNFLNLLPASSSVSSFLQNARISGPASPHPSDRCWEPIQDRRHAHTFARYFVNATSSAKPNAPNIHHHVVRPRRRSPRNVPGQRGHETITSRTVSTGEIFMRGTTSSPRSAAPASCKGAGAPASRVVNLRIAFVITSGPTAQLVGRPSSHAVTYRRTVI